MLKKIALFVIIFLFIPNCIFAEDFEINIICTDENKNILYTEKIFGNRYEAIKVQAPRLEEYCIIGADYKFATFDINNELRFIYTKSNSGAQIHKNYVFGYSADYFLPDKEITFSEAIIMLYNIYEVYKYNSDDFSSNYQKAYDYFIDLGFKEFFEEYNFEKEKLLSRYEFISLASLYIDNYLYDNVINAFLQLNNMSRTQKITRGEAVWIINILLGRDNLIENPQNLNFIDVPKNHKYYYSILEAAVSHECTNIDDSERWILK